jgi:hypothetical protein
MKYFLEEEDQAILSRLISSVTFLTQLLQNLDTRSCYILIIFDQGCKIYLNYLPRTLDWIKSKKN